MLATPEIIQEASKNARLNEVVPQWLAGIPLYRNRGSDVAAPGFGGLPLITKQDIRRDFPANFLGPEGDMDFLIEDEQIELEQTSGTSEDQRTRLLLPLGWWAQQEERALRLNAFVSRQLDESPHRRRVTISSPVCNGEICFTGVPSKTDRIIGATLFVSLSKLPFLWGAADLDRIVREVQEWQPLFLDMDPVYGVVLARYCEAQGIRLPSLKFIICTYEFLSVTHRRVLERVFGVPVFNLYGSTETGHLLMEDQPGVMRPSLETAHLELINQDSSGMGDLVVTTLTNPYMPLIRYRIGDLAEVRQQPYSTEYTLHGRALDAVTTPSGRRVSVLQVDRCFEDVSGIAHYQLLPQKDPDGWLLRIIPDAAPAQSSALDRLRQGLCELLEDGSVRIESTDTVMPENSGKFRLVYPRAATSR